jgi:hypothetical protein
VVQRLSWRLAPEHFGSLVYAVINDLSAQYCADPPVNNSSKQKHVAITYGSRRAAPATCLEFQSYGRHFSFYTLVETSIFDLYCAG